MRLFFALPLPEPLRGEMREWQVRARRAGLVAAYPRVEGLHLTLVFLGEVPEPRLSEVGQAGAAVAATTEDLILRTAALGGFPSRGGPKVLWLGLEPNRALDRLQENLAEALAPLGFPREDRPFTPHLTLARPKKGGLRVLPEAPEPYAWRASELVLFDSLPEPGGNRYERRGGWPLSASALLR